MKDIKFKVWDKGRQKILKPHAITFDTKTLAPFAVSVPGHSWEPAGKFELLQWTGLCDADGTDVYEGDIINISSVMYQVIWNKSIAGFVLVEPEGALHRDIRDIGMGNIVGNQYQNAPR
ncbi:MAG: hypothetical protein GX434_02725 [Peptococcaceae bacterium]|nr:hypothetical protein [Peptococcaceae bacterium]